jgi:hypothetical protein
MSKIKLEQFLATIPMQNKSDVELVLQHIKENQEKGACFFSFLGTYRLFSFSRVGHLRLAYFCEASGAKLFLTAFPNRPFFF